MSNVNCTNENLSKSYFSWNIYCFFSSPDDDDEFGDYYDEEYEYEDKLRTQSEPQTRTGLSPILETSVDEDYNEDYEYEYGEEDRPNPALVVKDHYANKRCSDFSSDGFRSV